MGILSRPSPPLVQTANGPVRGVEKDGIHIFKGIPYAAPPVGPLRFAPPQPAKGWAKPMDCSQFRPSAIQSGRLEPLLPHNEDCLYLNLWAPKIEPGTRHPVLVFIHGGGFANGSPSQILFDGSRFAGSGVVQVNIAYRLNALGFMAFPEIEAEYGNLGNCGLLDQIAALRWVQQNIEQFGGDPDNVTVCGESAGAYSVSGLMLSPLAKGLFHRAVLESGNLLGQPIVSPRARGERQQAISASRRFMRVFGAGNVSQMREADAASLAQASLFRNNMTTPPLYNFWPVFDGYVLPKDPYAALQAGEVNTESLLAGYNSDEGSLFIPRSTSEEAYVQLCDNIFGHDSWKVLDRFPVDKEHSAVQRSRSLIAMGLRFGSDVFCDAFAGRGQRCYFYNFDFHNPLLDRIGLGAMHALELLFVFATIPNLLLRDEKIRACMEYTHSAWLGFVRDGDPNACQTQAHWPAYTAENKEMMVINEAPAAAAAPDPEDVAFYLSMLWQA